jgi:hypothetical protein
MVLLKQKCLLPQTKIKKNLKLFLGGSYGCPLSADIISLLDIQNLVKCCKKIKGAVLRAPL